jgi:hypothetical protein
MVTYFAAWALAVMAGAAAGVGGAGVWQPSGGSAPNAPAPNSSAPNAAVPIRAPGSVLEGETRVVTPPRAAVAPEADAFLRELETADRSLRTLRAGVLYDRTFAVAGDRQTRVGTLVFVNEPRGEGARPERKFAVRFDRLIIGERSRQEQQEYVFDGTYLVERQPAQKLFVKRQVIGPGDAFDPFSIAEGVMPLPIAQRRDDIVARFDVALAEAGDGLDARADAKLIEFVKGARQVVLTPPPATADTEEYVEIRLWYVRSGDTGGWLPRMARTTSVDGDVSLVQLINVTLNEPVEEGMLSVEPPGEGWDVHVQEYRGE